MKKLSILLACILVLSSIAPLCVSATETTEIVTTTSDVTYLARYATDKPSVYGDSWKWDTNWGRGTWEVLTNAGSNNSGTAIAPRFKVLHDDDCLYIVFQYSDDDATEYEALSIGFYLNGIENKCVDGHGSAEAGKTLCENHAEYRFTAPTGLASTNNDPSAGLCYYSSAWVQTLNGGGSSSGNGTDFEFRWDYNPSAKYEVTTVNFGALSTWEIRIPKADLGLTAESSAICMEVGFTDADMDETATDGVNWSKEQFAWANSTNVGTNAVRNYNSYGTVILESAAASSTYVAAYAETAPEVWGDGYTWDANWNQGTWSTLGNTDAGTQLSWSNVPEFTILHDDNCIYISVKVDDTNGTIYQSGSGYSTYYGAETLAIGYYDATGANKILHITAAGNLTEEEDGSATTTRLTNYSYYDPAALAWLSSGQGTGATAGTDIRTRTTRQDNGTMLGFELRLPKSMFKINEDNTIDLELLYTDSAPASVAGSNLWGAGYYTLSSTVGKHNMSYVGTENAANFAKITLAAGCEHVEEEIPAVAATCTTDGSTAGVKCATCGKILTAPTTVPAAHTPGNPIRENETVVEGTDTVTCEEYVTCTVCGLEVSRTEKTVPAYTAAYAEARPSIDGVADDAAWAAATEATAAGTKTSNTGTATAPTFKLMHDDAYIYALMQYNDINGTIIGSGVVDGVTGTKGEVANDFVTFAFSDEYGYQNEYVFNAPVPTEGAVSMNVYRNVKGVWKENLVHVADDAEGFRAVSTYTNGGDIVWEMRIPKSAFGTLGAIAGLEVYLNDAAVVDSTNKWTLEAFSWTQDSFTNANYIHSAANFGALVFGEKLTCEHVEEEIPAVEATCTTAGSTAGTKCSVCGEILTAPEAIEALGHTEVEIPAVEATCTTAGSTAGVECSVCEEVLTAPEAIEALGHTEVEIPAVEATCTTAGSTAGVECSVCEEVLTAPEAVEALGHTEVEIPAVEATCTTAGSTAGVECSVCEEVLTAPEVVEALGHTEVEIPAVEATCNTAGSTAGVACSVCEEVLTAPTEVPATGEHTEGEAVIENNVPPTETEAGSYDSVVYCTVCNTELRRTEVEVPATGCAHTNTEEIPAVEATCTTAGSTAGTKCSDCDTILTAPEVIEALGHTEVEIPAVEATCTTAGSTAGVECSVCEEVLTAPEVVEATGHRYNYLEVFSFCEEEGYFIIKCGTCETTFDSRVDTEETDAYEASLAPGITINTSAKGHSEEEIPAVEATCTTTGLTAGTKCSRCEEVLTAPEVVEMTDHRYNNLQVYSFCEEEGYFTITCGTCGVTFDSRVNTEETDAYKASLAPYITIDTSAKGHTEGEAVQENVVDATLNSEGSYDSVVYCSACGVELSRTPVTVPALTGAAEVNGTKYATLREAIAAAEEGATVTLLSDIVLDESDMVTATAICIKIEKTVVIELNGKSISSPDVVFYVLAGGNLTINGEGNIISGTDNVGNSLVLYANGGIITVNGGTYTCGPDTTNTTNHTGDAVYANNGGIITINDGYFNYTETVWTLNLKDNSNSTIIVNGGEFVGFNPMNCVSEGAGTNFVAEGKHAVDNGEGVYVIGAHTEGEYVKLDSTYHVLTCAACGEEMAEKATHEGEDTCTVCGEVFSPIKNGLVGDQFYENNVIVKSYQLYEYEGATYYIGNNATIVKDCAVYVDGVWMAFDAEGKQITEGKVVVKVNGYTYAYAFENGARVTDVYTLFETTAGDLYYIDNGYRVATNKAVYIADEKTYYYFDAEGKKGAEGTTYIYDDRVYYSGEWVKGYQIISVNGDLYYIYDNYKIAKDRRLYINDELVGAKGWYTIDANGVIDVNSRTTTKNG